MSMMYFDPFRELDRMTGRLEGRQGPRFAPMDLYREGDHYLLNADLPGVDPGSIDVDVDGNMLSIRATRTLRGEEGVQWIAQERPSGSYQRQLQLGDGIDAERISAHYENGVLSVMIPVSEQAKPRRIEVTPAGQSQDVRAQVSG